MRAILHIGTEKTGTTSFQSFMHCNRERLRSYGILYPSELGDQNHRYIATYGLSLENSDDSVQGLGISSQKEMDDFYKIVEDRVTKQVTEAKACGIRTVILSSEHLHSRLKTVEQITRVRNLLAPLFDEIEVHIHLRPQVDVLVSLASTQTRVGGTVRTSFFQQARNNQLYYNYDLLVAAWEKVFGANNIYCLPFKVAPDFLSFISSHINLNFTGFQSASRINEALDVRVMAMVNALNDSGKGQRIDFRVLDLMPVEQKLQLDQATARIIQQRFQESNINLIKRRRDLQPGQLQPSWDKYPQEGNQHILEEECVFSGVFADLISYYNNIISGLQQVGK